MTAQPTTDASAPSTGGIPTARHVDHVGLTVPDLDEAVAFFRDVLGAEVLFRAGPYRDPSGDWMAEHLGVHPRAQLDLVMLRLGPTLNVELFEVSSPDARTDPPRTSDVGAGHLALYVDDMDAAVAFLHGRGVATLGAPTTIDDGPSAGLRWVHFRSPWGATFELVHWPAGMPYERATAARLYPGPDRADRNVGSRS